MGSVVRLRSAMLKVVVHACPPCAAVVALGRGSVACRRSTGAGHRRGVAGDRVPRASHRASGVDRRPTVAWDIGRGANGRGSGAGHRGLGARRRGDVAWPSPPWCRSSRRCVTRERRWYTASRRWCTSSHRWCTSSHRSDTFPHGSGTSSHCCGSSFHGRGTSPGDQPAAGRPPLGRRMRPD